MTRLISSASPGMAVRVTIAALLLSCSLQAESRDAGAFKRCGSLPLADRISCRQRIVNSQQFHSASPAAPASDSVRAIDFGADPTGKTDSWQALQSMVDTVWIDARNFSINAPDYPDLGGLVLDLTGGHWGGNCELANGALHAAEDFPADGFLVSLSAVAANTHFDRYRYITFRNIEFDAAQRAYGGLNLTQAEEIKITNCLFTGYTGSGLLSYGTVNELFVSSTWFREYKDYALCHSVDKTGTAMTLWNNDHSVDDVIIYCSAAGVVANGSASVFRNIHVYTEGPLAYPRAGLYIYAAANNIRINECYLDGCAIMLENPYNTQVSNNFFLLAEGNNASRGGVVLHAVTEDHIISGLQIQNNLIGGGHTEVGYDFVALNQTRGSFSDVIMESAVAQNALTSVLVNTDHVLPKRTRLTRTAMFSATDVFTFVCDDLLLPLSPQASVTYSVQPSDEGDWFVPHVLTNRTGRTIEIRAQRVMTATVTVTVDLSQDV